MNPDSRYIISLRIYPDAQNRIIVQKKPKIKYFKLFKDSNLNSLGASTILLGERNTMYIKLSFIVV